MLPFLVEEYKTKGNAAFKDKNYFEAVNWFTAALNLDATNYVLYSNRSAANLYLGRYQEALDDANISLELNPGWAKAYARKGSALFHLNDYKGSKEAYQIGLELDPTSEPCRQGIERFNRKPTQANERAAQNVEELKTRGNNLFRDGNYLEAIEAFSDAIAQDPLNHVLYSNRSAAYCSLERYKEALEDANRSIEMNSNWPKAYCRKAQALYGMGNAMAATQAYYSGLEIDPENEGCKKGLQELRVQLRAPVGGAPKPLTREGEKNLFSERQLTKDEQIELYKTRGNEAYRNNEYKDALKHFTAALKLDPKNYILFSNRSATYAGLFRFQEALEDAQKSIDINPKWAKGYGRKGTALVGQREYSAATKAYMQGLDIDPNNDICKEGLSSLRRQGLARESVMEEKPKPTPKPQETPTDESGTPVVYPNTQEYAKTWTTEEYKNKGNEAFKGGEYLVAVNWFTLAIDSDPTNYLMYSNRSGAFCALARYKEALDDALKVIELKPEWPKAYSRKGAALIGLGNISEAISAYERGIVFDPSNDVCKVELEKLLKRQAREKEAEQQRLEREREDEEERRRREAEAEAAAAAASAIFDAPTFAVPTEIPIIPIIDNTPPAPHKEKPKKPEISPMQQAPPPSPDEVFYSRPKPSAKVGATSIPKTTPPPAAPKPTPPPPTPKPTQPERSASPEPDLESGTALSFKDKGNEYFRKQDYKRALKYFSASLKLDPNNHIVYSNRSATYTCLFKYQEALDDANKSISLNSKWGKAYSRKGAALCGMKNYAAAIEAFRKGVEVEPSNELCKSELTRLEKFKADMMKEGWWDEGNTYTPPSSVNAWESKSVDPNEGTAEDYKTRGNNAFRVGNNDEAVLMFSYAIGLDPDNHILYSNRAAAQERLMRFQQALDDANTSINLKPDWAKAYSRKGAALMGLKDYARAMQAFKQGLELEPDNEACKAGIARLESKPSEPNMPVIKDLDEGKKESESTKWEALPRRTRAKRPRTEEVEENNEKPEDQNKDTPEAEKETIIEDTTTTTNQEATADNVEPEPEEQTTSPLKPENENEDTNTTEETTAPVENDEEEEPAAKKHKTEEDKEESASPQEEEAETAGSSPIHDQQEQTEESTQSNGVKRKRSASETAAIPTPKRKPGKKKASQNPELEAATALASVAEDESTPSKTPSARGRKPKKVADAPATIPEGPESISTRTRKGKQSAPSEGDGKKPKPAKST